MKISQSERVLRRAVRQIIDYPKDRSRADDDGYPREVVHDEFAYKRIVDSYRNGLRNALKACLRAARKAKP